MEAAAAVEVEALAILGGLPLGFLEASAAVEVEALALLGGLPLGLLEAAIAVEVEALSLFRTDAAVEPEALALLGGLPVGLFRAVAAVEVEATCIISEYRVVGSSSKSSCLTASAAFEVEVVVLTGAALTWKISMLLGQLHHLHLTH